MSTKVFIIALPSMRDMVEEIGSLIEEAFDKPKAKRCEPKRFEEPCDLTPRHMRVNEPCGNTQPWGVGGTPANEDLRFGFQCPPIDEPRSQDYDSRWEFEDDHEAYDRLIDAAEDCVERGLARPEGVTAHKCEAIRQPIGCPPPMNINLIGETDWWTTEPCMRGI